MKINIAIASRITLIKTMKNKFLISAITLIAILFASCGNQQAKEETVNNPNTVVSKKGPKSVLIISSSPRRGGNSETLCLQLMKGAEESKHKVEMLNLNDYDIKFFAKTEYERGERNDDDDAIQIIKKMAAADVIVLSSPVYFYSMTAQMKALIDRVYNYEKDLQNKEFYYIVTCTDKEKEALDGTIMGFRGFVRCLYNGQERGIVYGNGARERGTIDEKPAMKEAYEMGKNI